MAALMMSSWSDQSSQRMTISPSVAPGRRGGDGLGYGGDRGRSGLGGGSGGRGGRLGGGGAAGGEEGAGGSGRGTNEQTTPRDPMLHHDISSLWLSPTRSEPGKHAKRPIVEGWDSMPGQSTGGSLGCQRT